MKSQNESQALSSLAITSAHRSLNDELIRMQSHYSKRLDLLLEELDLIRKRLKTVLYVHSTQINTLSFELKRDIQTLGVLSSESDFEAGLGSESEPGAKCS